MFFILNFKVTLAFELIVLQYSKNNGDGKLMRKDS